MIMARRPRRFLLAAGMFMAIAAIACSGGGKSGSKYMLKYERRKDSLFKVLDAHRSVVKRNAEGRETTTDVSYRAKYDVEVYNAGSWGMRLDIVYNNWTMEIDDPDLLRQPSFQFLPGKKVYADVSPAGEVSELNGFDKLPEIDLGPGADPIGEVRFKNEIRDLFPGLPGKAVRQGDSWTVTRQFTEPIYGGEILLSVDYTYTVGGETRESGRECVQIDGTYSVEGSGRVLRDGVEFAITVAGEGKQTVYFSDDLGMFVRLNEETHLYGDATDGAGRVVDLDQKRERVAILTF
jgi:hypothetical protein